MTWLESNATALVWVLSFRWIHPILITDDVQELILPSVAVGNEYRFRPNLNRHVRAFVESSPNQHCWTINELQRCAVASEEKPKLTDTLALGAAVLINI